jgi:hypothetical protein
MFFEAQEISQIFWQTKKKSLSIMDRIVELFSCHHYADSALVREHEQKISQMRLISSGMGDVFSGDGEIIKRTNGSKFKKILRHLHRVGNPTQVIPNTFLGRPTLVVPNHLLEAVLPREIEKVLRGRTAGCQRVSMVAYADRQNEVYYSQEDLVPIDLSAITPIELVEFVFQLVHFLALGQKKMRLTHNDLHFSNVMLRRKDPSIINAYELPNGETLYLRSQHEVVVIDYYWARAEIGGTTVIPKAAFYLGEREIRDYYAYNPWSDIGNFLLSLKGRVEKEGIVGDLPKAVDELLATFGISDFSEIRPYLGGEVRRQFHPETYFTFDPIRPGFPFLDCQRYMEELAANLKDTSVHPAAASSYEDLLKMPLTSFLTDRQIRHPSIRRFAWSDAPIHAYLPYSSNWSNESFDGISVENVSEKTLKYDFRHFLGTYGEGTTNFVGRSFQWPLHGLEATIVKIDVKEAIRNGYQFRIDCCRIDPRLHLQRVKSGVVVNGGPFMDTLSESRSYLPLRAGEIPSPWLGEYGRVKIEPSGTLEIRRLVTNMETQDTSLIAGPILINNGQLAVNYQSLSREMTSYQRSRIPKWHCLEPKEGQERFRTITHEGQSFMNCQKARETPGQLYTASQFQSRTALGLKQEGDRQFVVLVHLNRAEEREDPTEGVDLLQLAQLGLDLGLTGMVALDGNSPEASQLCWRKPSDPFIRIASPEHMFAYPVGNVLSLVKT